MSHPYSLDAAVLLDFGTPSTDPLPAPEEGVIVLRIPDGLSLQALRDSPVGKEVMHQQDWYDEYPWSTASPHAGTYRLRLPVPGTNRKAAAKQQTMLPAGEQLAPVALVAAALLCIHLRGGADPLNDAWTRCAEQAAGGSHVALFWLGGRLQVLGTWDVTRGNYLWASAVRAALLNLAS